MNLSASIEEMRQAVALEIRASATDSSKNVEVARPRLIAETEEGFLYSFDAEVQILVPPETPVTFKAAGFNRIQGTWIGQDEFEILLTLKERLDPAVKRGRLVIDLSFILEALSLRLSEIETAPGLGLVQDLLAGTTSNMPEKANRVSESLRDLRRAGQNINSSQESAIRNSLEQPIHFVWGPPGTGKTANLSHVCRALCEEGESVLVIAHAHAAVDVAMLRVAESMDGHTLLTRGKVLRIGFSQNPEVRRHKYLTVLGILRQTEPDLLDKWEHLEEQKKQLQAEMRRTTPATAKSLERQLSDVRQQLESLRARVKEVEAALIERSAIVGCTAAKAIIDERIWKRNVDTVVIDEVSMMNFPFVTALASRARKRVLQFGDFRQLPPIVVSEDELAMKWLGEDSFHIAGVTKSVENGVEDQRITMLEEQYRMHSKICNVVSLLSYGERLITADGVDRRVEPIAIASPHSGESLVLADTTEFRSVCMKETKPGRFSRMNPMHAVIAVNLAYNLSSSNGDVCIITPYRAQARLIAAIAAELKLEIPIATVHRFQGAERGIVIFDVCDAFPQQRASRLTGHSPDIAVRLINVGISRAKGKLLVLADRHFISNYHDGRSPTRKVCGYFAQFGTARPLELDDLETNESPFEWFDDFSSAQMSLAGELISSRQIRLNLPDGFLLSSQVSRVLEEQPSKEVTVRTTKLAAGELSGKKMNVETSVASGGFFALLDRGAFIGGRDAEAPVVFIRGNVAPIFASVFCIDEQEERERYSLRR